MLRDLALIICAIAAWEGTKMILSRPSNRDGNCGRYGHIDDNDRIRGSNETHRPF